MIPGDTRRSLNISHKEIGCLIAGRMPCFQHFLGKKHGGSGGGGGDGCLSVCLSVRVYSKKEDGSFNEINNLVMKKDWLGTGQLEADKPCLGGQESLSHS